MFERRASPMERKIDEVIAMLQMHNEALQVILNILQPPQPQPQPPLNISQYVPPPNRPQPKEETDNDLPQLKPVDQPKPM